MPYHQTKPIQSRPKTLPQDQEEPEENSRSSQPSTKKRAMPPPQQQLPSDHATPRPRPRPRPTPPARESSVPVPAAKRAPPPAPAAAKKMARPASVPDLTALPASTPAKNNGAPAAKSGSGAGTGRPAFMAPRGAQTVRPARRLAPGTAVYVRTTFRPRNVNIRCRILLWLRARVVSSPDAYHCTVKYAADLSDMFAGKIVSKPADHVRLAPRPTPKTMAPALEAKEAASLPRRRR